MEVNGHAFCEIGVVARNCVPYIPFLRRVFEEHGIPFFTTATTPLLEEPVAKVWWQLAGLREEQYPWRSLLDVVTSPFFRGLSVNSASAHELRNVWSQAVRHFRIVRGREDWERLVTVAKDPAVIGIGNARMACLWKRSSDALQQLAELVLRVIADCQVSPGIRIYW